MLAMIKTLPLIVEIEDDIPQVTDGFKRGFRNAIILSVLLFWAPVIFLIGWLVQR